VDLPRIVAGPLATQILGDYGAEVIKIEIPGGGDDSRAWAPPTAPDGSAAYFFCVMHRGMVEEIEHETAGPIRLVGIPVKFSESPGSIRLAPPVLGQHTAETLTTRLGLTADEVRDLPRDGVI
jgi:crotonobetainyl-CoA:carnitine CoA-transferase CaiB-like acyl-CoA transferase